MSWIAGCTTRSAAGLAGLERAGYAPFDAIAARMVDGQAPGVAGLLRALPGEIAGEGWPGRLLDQFGLLHLLIEAHRSLDRLDPDLAATVRSRVGYPVAKDEVLARPAVTDHWLALGMVETMEYRLETRRVWLYGAETGRWAVLLSFAPIGGFLSSEALAGDHLQAALHFYPGSGQLRALVGTRTSTTQPPVYPKPLTLAETQRRFAEMLAADPWATRMPAAIDVHADQADRHGGALAAAGCHRGGRRAHRAAGRPVAAAGLLRRWPDHGLRRVVATRLPTAECAPG